MTTRWRNILTILFGTLIPALLLARAAGHVVLPTYQPPGRRLYRAQRYSDHPLRRPVWPADCPLAGLVKSFPALAAAGIAGTGLTPALIALVLYALLPLVRGGVVAGVKPGSARRAGKRPCDGDERAPVFLENTAAACASAAGSQPAGGDSANRGDGGDCRADRGGRLWGTGLPGGLLSSALDLVLLGVVPTIVLAVVLDALFALWLALLRRRAMIEFHDVSKTFAGRPAASHLNLHFAEGAFSVLIGTSGSGKSTTLKMINRLVEHDSGTIRFAGEEIRSAAGAGAAAAYGLRHSVHRPVSPWTVAQNIATVPQLEKWSRGRSMSVSTN